MFICQQFMLTTTLNQNYRYNLKLRFFNLEMPQMLSLLDANLLVAATITVAILIRSTFGFGDAIFAVPILGLLTDLTTGVPVLAAIGSTITLLICVIDFRSIEWNNVAKLLVPAILGIPVGIHILAFLPTSIVLFGLGTVVCCFAAYTLFVKREEYSVSENMGIGFGFAGGVLGGAFNMYGLPVAMFGGLRRWKPAQFRILLSSFFLPTGLIGITGHWYVGLWQGAFFNTYLLALGPSLVAMYLGKKLNQRISPEKFQWIIWTFVLILGGLLVFRNARAVF